LTEIVVRPVHNERKEASRAYRREEEVRGELERNPQRRPLVRSCCFRTLDSRTVWFRQEEDKAAIRNMAGAYTTGGYVAFAFTSPAAWPTPWQPPAK
jgi:hypothetical protein